MEAQAFQANRAKGAGVSNELTVLHRSSDLSILSIRLMPSLGLHARVTARIVAEAGNFPDTDISLEHSDRRASCLSVTSLMLLGASCGSTVKISALGKSHEEAANAVAGIVGTEEQYLDETEAASRQVFRDWLKTVVQAEKATWDKSGERLLANAARLLSENLICVVSSHGSARFCADIPSSLMIAPPPTRESAARVFSVLRSQASISNNALVTFGVLEVAPDQLFFASAPCVTQKEIERVVGMSGRYNWRAYLDPEVPGPCSGRCTGIHMFDECMQDSRYEQQVAELKKNGFAVIEKQTVDQNGVAYSEGMEPGIWTRREKVLTDGEALLDRVSVARRWIRGTLASPPAEAGGFVRLDEPACPEEYAAFRNASMNSPAPRSYEEILRQDLKSTLGFLSTGMHPEKTVVINESIRERLGDTGLVLPNGATITEVLAIL